MCSFFLLLAPSLWAQAIRVRDDLPYPYHPNRPGALAYAQGGAFVASTGNVTAMLFNPAGITPLEGELALTLEGGWNSRTEYLSFFNSDFTSNTQPLQFAGLAVVPKAKWAVGAYYFRPTDYELDFGEFVTATPNDPDGAGEVLESVFERRQYGLGINLARSMGTNWHLGIGMEWRRAEARDEVIGALAQGKADAVRLAIGSIVQVRDWRLGVSLQSQYKAAGEAVFTNGSDFDLEPFKFTTREPASVRAGFVSPLILKRLRVNGDFEYKDFKAEEAIARRQFYGDATLQLTSFFQLAWGAFTFRKDYSNFVDGPVSETFLTCGGNLMFGHFNFTASFMEGDLLNQNFEGQKFLSLAVGYTLAKK